MTQNATLKQSPLAQYHADYHAQMVEYAGWEMPIKYETSIKDEHEQTRNSGGIFDVSHMGRLTFKGKDAIRLLEHTCSRKIGSMQEGQCRYGLICNEQGGVLDDVIVNRMGEKELLVVVNASNRDKIIGHMNSVIADRGFDVKMEDRTEKTAMIAIQGPKVMELIGKVSSEIQDLKRYRFLVKNLMIAKVIVARTGYTGEDGVEVIMPSSIVKMAISMLMKEMGDEEAQEMLKPCGLGARDTLRLEAGMPLYGHELGEDINALSCGIDFAIALDKSVENEGETFIGQEALLKTRDAGGPATKLVGFEIDSKRTPRQGMPILLDGTQVGTVTSGCASPTLGKSIAMGFVPSDKTEVGTKFEIDAGRATLPASIVKLPFYKR
ncbi:MAG: glycine cleavage system protein T [Phycisphaerae bacterium]|nr:glycine cleavage system protein T [Phycisphaerae bacterium]MBM90291.1 glycine cleavage system protein T [Phycisphaerae bacterium]HCT45643.1 glycine cleavage system aminomethyltransferase GcvT [Phycisphaerales bacterium]